MNHTGIGMMVVHCDEQVRLTILKLQNMAAQKCCIMSKIIYFCINYIILSKKNGTSIEHCSYSNNAGCSPVEHVPKKDLIKFTTCCNIVRKIVTDIETYK